jgi:hypothetical protein
MKLESRCGPDGPAVSTAFRMGSERPVGVLICAVFSAGDSRAVVDVWVECAERPVKVQSLIHARNCRSGKGAASCLRQRSDVWGSGARGVRSALTGLYHTFVRRRPFQGRDFLCWRSPGAGRLRRPAPGYCMAGLRPAATIAQVGYGALSLSRFAGLSSLSVIIFQL